MDEEISYKYKVESEIACGNWGMVDKVWGIENEVKSIKLKGKREKTVEGRRFKVERDKDRLRLRKTKMSDLCVVLRAWLKRQV